MTSGVRNSSTIKESKNEASCWLPEAGGCQGCAHSLPHSPPGVNPAFLHRTCRRADPTRTAPQPHLPAASGPAKPLGHDSLRVPRWALALWGDRGRGEAESSLRGGKERVCPCRRTLSPPQEPVTKATHPAACQQNTHLGGLRGSNRELPLDQRRAQAWGFPPPSLSTHQSSSLMAALRCISCPGPRASTPFPHCPRTLAPRHMAGGVEQGLSGTGGGTLESKDREDGSSIWQVLNLCRHRAKHCANYHSAPNISL